MKKISIIVPLYNIVEYLPRCVNSILSQTYGDFELILVDDGSTDLSGELCDQYMIADKRVRVLHKQNEGVSKARNCGLEMATGDWITFIDGDDYVVPQYLDILLRTALDNDCLMSCCNMVFQNQDGINYKTAFMNSAVLQNVEILQGYFCEGALKTQFYGPVNKLFHKSIIRDIVFEDYALGEDILFIYEVLNKISTVAFAGEIGYHYIKRTDSATTSKFNFKKLDYVKAAHRILDLSKNHSKEIYEKALIWTVRISIVTLRQIYMNRMESQLQDFIKSERIFVKENQRAIRKLDWKRQMDYVILEKFPMMYAIFQRNKRGAKKL